MAGVRYIRETLEYLELGSSCSGLFMNDLASREMRE